MILRAKCVSPGVAEGRIHVVDVGSWLATALARESVQDADAEIARFHAAKRRAAMELERVQHLLTQRGRAHEAGIFAAHSVLLEDPKLAERIEQEIRVNLQSAEAAVARASIDFHNQLKASSDSAIQDKAADVLDVGHRLVQSLGEPPGRETPRANILVAASIAPSELVRFVHHGVVGVITETCGAKSHTAILARGLGIPMVTAIEGGTKRMVDGSMVLIDATSGTVLLDPAPSDEEMIRQIRASKAPAPAAGLTPAPTQTHDGVPIRLLLNISDPIEAEQSATTGLAGVGLFRTEFLYMDRTSWPTEEESFQSYQRVAKAVGNGELNIRLADFGAEKCPVYADFPVNRNPSLGIRGVRLLLERPDILEPQVRAISRLAKDRSVTVLLPMVDTFDTLERIRAELCRICSVASRGELPFQLGTMIEVPAVALAIDEVIGEVDSVAVGLNDLTQYLLAADRDDEFVESYHDALQPVVLRLLHAVVAAADAHSKPVTMCGELAGDPSLTALLLALGVRRFSVSRSQANQIGAALGALSVADVAPLGAEILKCASGKQVRDVLRARGILQ